MSGQLPGIVIAWAVMAVVSLATALWVGISTWTIQADLQIDCDAMQSLQAAMSDGPLPKRFSVLDLEDIGKAWSQRIQMLDSASAVLESVDLKESNPLDGSDLVEHLVTVNISGISLAELQQLLNGKFADAQIAGVSVVTPKKPMQGVLELWDVRLTLTQISLGG